MNIIRIINMAKVNEKYTKKKRLFVEKGKMEKHYEKC